MSNMQDANMQKLFKLMRDYEVPAFSIDNPAVLTGAMGGFVIYYYGNVGSYIDDVDDVFESMFNTPGSEPGDDEYTLLVCKPSNSVPNDAFRLGVDY